MEEELQDWSFVGDGASDEGFEGDQDFMVGSNISDTAILSGETYKGDAPAPSTDDDPTAVDDDWGISDGNTTTSSSASISQTATIIILFAAMLPLASI